MRPKETLSPLLLKIGEFLIVLAQIYPDTTMAQSQPQSDCQFCANNGHRHKQGIPIP